MAGGPLDEKDRSPFYPQLSSLGWDHTRVQEASEHLPVGRGAEGSGGGRGHVCHKADPTGGRKLLLSVLQGTLEPRSQCPSQSPELSRRASREHCRRTGKGGLLLLFCSATGAPDSLSSVMGSPGPDFFQVSLHKNFVNYRGNPPPSYMGVGGPGMWRLSVSQGVSGRAGPVTQS